MNNSLPFLLNRNPSTAAGQVMVANTAQSSQHNEIERLRTSLQQITCVVDQNMKAYDKSLSEQVPAFIEHIQTLAQSSPTPIMSAAIDSIVCFSEKMQHYDGRNREDVFDLFCQSFQHLLENRNTSFENDLFSLALYLATFLGERGITSKLMDFSSQISLNNSKEPPFMALKAMEHENIEFMTKLHQIDSTLLGRVDVRNGLTALGCNLLSRKKGAQPNQFKCFQSPDTQGVEWSLAKISLMGTTDAKSTGPALAKAASNELAEHCSGRAPRKNIDATCELQELGLSKLFANFGVVGFHNSLLKCNINLKIFKLAHNDFLQTHSGTFTDLDFGHINPLGTMLETHNYDIFQYAIQNRRDPIFSAFLHEYHTNHNSHLRVEINEIIDSIDGKSLKDKSIILPLLILFAETNTDNELLITAILLLTSDLRLLKIASCSLTAVNDKLTLLLSSKDHPDLSRRWEKKAQEIFKACFYNDSDCEEYGGKKFILSHLKEHYFNKIDINSSLSSETCFNVYRDHPKLVRWMQELGLKLVQQTYKNGSSMMPKILREAYSVLNNWDAGYDAKTNFLKYVVIPFLAEQALFQTLTNSDQEALDLSKKIKHISERAPKTNATVGLFALLKEQLGDSVSSCLSDDCLEYIHLRHERWANDVLYKKKYYLLEISDR